jgi:signal transduction histidine kinase
MVSPLRSMRARIVLMNTLILAALFGAIGAAIPPLVRSTMLRSIDRELQNRAERSLQGPGHGPRFRGGPDGPPGPPIDENGEPGSPLGDRSGEFNRPGSRGKGRPPMPPEPPTEAGTVLRPRQIPLNSQSGAPAPPAPWDPAAYSASAARQQVWSTVWVDGEPVRVLSVPFPPRGPVESVLQMPYPLSEVERAISSLIGTLLALAPIALLAAAGGGYALTGRALRPVAQITSAAAQIGAQDLERRIPVEGEDEFARLAATFNGMLERLDLAFADRERLITQLREAVEQQRRFTADASHELKTPLTAIKANTSLLLSGSPTVEDYREASAEIDVAAGIMSRLVQDLLILARSDAGQLAREKTDVPLLAPIERAASQARKTSAAPICVDVPPGLIVNGQEDALVRLFSNLLDNAARHTPADGSITVHAGHENGFASVSVIDTGSGIPPEHLPHLGERFYRVDTHRARAYGGSGLGVAICHEIASAHGGTLSIASAVGTGTTVTVRLPIAAA